MQCTSPGVAARVVLASPFVGSPGTVCPGVLFYLAVTILPGTRTRLGLVEYGGRPRLAHRGARLAVSAYLSRDLDDAEDAGHFGRLGAQAGAHLPVDED
jgi:hypothetical protein